MRTKGDGKEGLGFGRYLRLWSGSALGGAVYFLVTFIAHVSDPFRIMVILALHALVVRPLITPDSKGWAFGLAVLSGLGVGLITLMMTASYGYIIDGVRLLSSLLAGLVWSMGFWAINRRMRRRSGLA